MWSWVAVILFAALSVVLLKTDALAPYHRLAKNPANLEKIIKVDLPDVAGVVSGVPQYETYTTDGFEHHYSFKETLSDDCIRRLEYLCITDTIHWRKDIDTIYSGYDYLYSNDGVLCLISNHSAWLQYYAPEDEGYFIIGASFMIVILMTGVLVIWGMVLLIMTIVRKARKIER